MYSTYTDWDTWDDPNGDYDAEGVDEFPFLRSILAEEYSLLPNEALEDVFYGVVDDVDIDDYEDFLKSAAGFGKSASRVLGQAAPGAISGALQGATAGAALGPYGALAGGILGAVGGGVQSYQAAQQPRRAPTAPTAAPAAVAGAPKAPAAPQAPVAAPAVVPVLAPAMVTSATAVPPGIPAAVQLMTILQRPEIMQAIMAVIMGQLGRRKVPVNGVPVSTEEFLNSIAVLAGRAAADAAGTAHPSNADALWSEGVGDSTYDLTPRISVDGLLGMLHAAPVDLAWPTHYGNINDESDLYDEIGQIDNPDNRLLLRTEDYDDLDAFEDAENPDEEIFETGRLELD